MRLFKLACKRETAIPILALTFASVFCVALVFARVFWTGNVRYAFLVWNLFLAWLPLAFALLAQEKFRLSSGRDWRFGALACVWLLFFPNAPYIFTDVIHLTTHFYRHFWVDLVLILSCALTGLVLGFVSLYLMQGVVKRLLGSAVSWIFIAIIAGLSGFGVCLGRFLRFNSWDVLVKPMKVYHGIGLWMTDPFGHPMTFAFPVLFGTFLFVAYLMLYALTHLQQAQLIPLSPSPTKGREPCQPVSG